MNPIDDTPPMRQAIAASREALNAGDMPYGAALAAPDGRVLLVERNRQHSTLDVTAHAERVLLRRAADALGAEALRGATVYASGEPCAKCAGALYWAGVGRVVWAASQPAMADLLGGPLLPTRCADLLAAATPPVPVQSDVLASEALAVLREAAAR